MPTAELGRTRDTKQHGALRRPNVDFINPYPWMSAPEAMVQLALEEHRIPFSWRFMDGDAPQFQQLMANQGYQPEFTLREYRTVVMVQGAYWGSLPGVLDNLSLAQVLLEADLWRVLVLWESDIRTLGAWNLMVQAIPALGSITGAPRANPWGVPDLMSRLRSRTQHRPVHPKLEYIHNTRSTEDGRRTIRRGGRRFADSGRRRIGRAGSVPSGFKSR